MSTINKQSSFFQKVPGVQDISHESAAACSGGTIRLYTGNNFTGTFQDFIGRAGTRISNLGVFNNRASSFGVGGTGRIAWRLFTGPNFTGSSVVVGGGAVRSGNFAPGFDNNIESMQVI